MTRFSDLVFFLFLAMLAALPPLSIDMGLPALHQIIGALHTDADHAGLSLSLFMAGFAATPIIYGPLSDRYGRRPVLLAGLSLFTAGGLAAAAAPSIFFLLAARCLEGAGAGAGTALAFAIIRDRHQGEAARAQLAYLQMIMAFAPMIAPTIGSVLLLGGWRIIYGVLGLGGAGLLAYTLFGFTETHAPRRAAGGIFGQLLAGYRALFTHRIGLGFALVYGLSFGVLFSYVAGSPLVFMGHYGVSARTYGLIFAGTALGIMGGTFTNTRLIHHGVAAGRPLAAGLVLYLLTGGLMLTILAVHIASLAPLLCLLIVSAYAYGLVAPNASHGALSALPEISGIAGAALTSFQMTVGCTASAIVAASFQAYGRYAMVVPMAGFGVATIVVYLAMVRPALRREGSNL
jgi:DHA1 family bicyclomycin/chloramphenicol resistance-like MFS transporter